MINGLTVQNISEREREVESRRERSVGGARWWRGGAFLSHDMYLFVVYQLQQGGGCIGLTAGKGESKDQNAQKEELHVFAFFFVMGMC